MIGIWYDDGFGFSDLDRIRIPLKFFGADRIIKFQYPHNTGTHHVSEESHFSVVIIVHMQYYQCSSLYDSRDRLEEDVMIKYCL